MQGNVIRPYADGTPAFGNSSGIVIAGVANQIGGLEAGAGNIIAFNQMGVKTAPLTTEDGPLPIEANSSFKSDLCESAH